MSFFFFFSSRRRHTRLTCDWSSDVCSSDLVRKRRAPSIIIVSLVDILTILLIFFVVSTTFKKDQPEMQINLPRSEEHTSELQSHVNLVCRLLLEKKKKQNNTQKSTRTTYTI